MRRMPMKPSGAKGEWTQPTAPAGSSTFKAQRVNLRASFIARGSLKVRNDVWINPRIKSNNVGNVPKIAISALEKSAFAYL